MKVGFLGLGKMGTALAFALRKAGQAEQIFFYDIRPLAKELRNDLAGLVQCSDAQTLEEKSDVLILCVKPQDMQAALGLLQGHKKYISIAAGLSIATLGAYLQGSRQEVMARVMPNLAALVSCSASVVYCDDNAFFSQVQQIFSVFGTVLRIQKEEQMHAVTALSGSGPALVATFLQALGEGGIVAGLPHKTAMDLAKQTVIGTMELLNAKSMEPAELIKQVSSPGGTTVAALGQMEEKGFGTVVVSAMQAAADRSRELAGD